MRLKNTIMHIQVLLSCLDRITLACLASKQVHRTARAWQNPRTKSLLDRSRSRNVPGSCWIQRTDASTLDSIPVEMSAGHVGWDSPHTHTHTNTERQSTPRSFYSILHHCKYVTRNNSLLRFQSAQKKGLVWKKAKRLRNESPHRQSRFLVFMVPQPQMPSPFYHTFFILRGMCFRQESSLCHHWSSYSPFSMAC